eukprot:8511608-Alexandrium_andersonii.AAC.1
MGDLAAMALQRGLRSRDWPNDVVSPAQMKPLRVPFVQSKPVMVLSPEAVHGAAYTYLTKHDDSTPLRIWGSLGVHLAD